MNFLRQSRTSEIVISLVLALIVFNVHVSTAGDALWSLGRPDRHLLYLAILLASIVLMSATIVLNAVHPLEQSARITSSLAVLALVSIFSVLLDVQDGPVRTIQLLFLWSLFGGIIAVGRLARASHR